MDEYREQLKFVRECGYVCVYVWVYLYLCVYLCFSPFVCLFMTRNMSRMIDEDTQYSTRCVFAITIC